jgi:hypothetical protein
MAKMRRQDMAIDIATPFLSQFVVWHENKVTEADVEQRRKLEETQFQQQKAEEEKVISNPEYKKKRFKRTDAGEQKRQVDMADAVCNIVAWCIGKKRRLMAKTKAVPLHVTDSDDQEEEIEEEDERLHDASLSSYPLSVQEDVMQHIANIGMCLRLPSDFYKPGIVSQCNLHDHIEPNKAKILNILDKICATLKYCGKITKARNAVAYVLNLVGKQLVCVNKGRRPRTEEDKPDFTSTGRPDSDRFNRDYKIVDKESKKCNLSSDVEDQKCLFSRKRRRRSSTLNGNKTSEIIEADPEHATQTSGRGNQNFSPFIIESPVPLQ